MAVRWSFVLLTVAFLTTGCGGESYPETYPVTGIVTLDGKPVEGANVALVSGDPAVRSAGGMTDAQGNFSVTTYFDPQHQPEGAMPGDYAVTVSKLEELETSAAPSAEEMMAGQMKFTPLKSLLPKKYGDPKTSGFKVTVGEAPVEPLKLDLQGRTIFSSSMLDRRA
ncbi:MAG: carboxypeptidase regulatory-like domain-containing protein [Planctomycetaceae bacterium]|nr:carboxypeptidase regulatory-like domain-containing protein [Planctomycetaceae bacterium]